MKETEIRKMVKEELYRLMQVDSANIQDLEYDGGSRTLTITFKKNGRKYEYYQVPKEIWQELVNAESYGKYFNANIKNTFKFKEIS